MALTKYLRRTPRTPTLDATVESPSRSVDIPVVPPFELPSGIDLTLRFAPHYDAADLGTPEEITKLFKSAQIIAPELFGWTPSLLQQANRIAQGDIALLRSAMSANTNNSSDAYVQTLFRAIFDYGQGLRVACLDLPAESPLVAQINANDQSGSEIINSWLPYDEALHRLELNLIEDARLHRLREIDILANMTGRLKATIASSARLSRRWPVAVLMLMGTAHRQIATDIEYNVLKIGVADFTFKVAIHHDEPIVASMLIAERYLEGFAPGRRLTALSLMETLAVPRLRRAEGTPLSTHMAQVFAKLSLLSEDQLRTHYECWRADKLGL
jgi:hypothetical protein